MNKWIFKKNLYQQFFPLDFIISSDEFIQNFEIRAEQENNWTSNKLP